MQFKIDSSNDEVDYVISEEILSETITKWIDDLYDVLLSDRQHRFAIHHLDLSVNNIFINEELNITYIID